MELYTEGSAYENKGDLVNARRCFDKAIQLDPTSWLSYLGRARLDMQEDKSQQQIYDATMALRYKSSFSASAILRADANAKLGHYDAAVRELDQVISLGTRGSAYAAALNASAWLRATCLDPRYRNGQLALRHAALGCRITWDRNPGYLDTLAAANAELGNFDAAIRIQEKALGLRETPGESKNLRRHMHEHMASFKQHRPWRE